jgi:mono/diheme cytochrome c family protein
VLNGGKSGPAIVPGKPDESLLIQAVSHTHPRLKMPPSGKLSDEQIATLRTWVASGAHWDGPPVSSQPEAGTFTPAQRDFWAFQPPRKPSVPTVRNRNWVRSPIDAFVAAKLEENGLGPAAAAERRIWIRRATYDLIGLPPTPGEVDAFVGDLSPEAPAKVIDRLLASSRYGERWGRHWLDVARYADEDALGLSSDPFPNAYRYRDWVIQAFNDDMPYDLFVKAQIAGDLLETDSNRGSLRPGLGMFALGPWYYKIIEPAKARADERHDRVDVLTRGFLGLTVACARCHDHKYDPISTRDYYALGGVFANTEAFEFPLAPDAEVQRFEAAKKKIADKESELKKVLDAARSRIFERQARQTASYIRAALGGGPPGPLDRETIDRWARYLKSGAKEHTFVPADAFAGADELQKTALAVLAEQKEIDAYNAAIIEASNKSKDAYDIFCKGCNAETRTLQRDRYVLWTDLFGAHQRSFEKEPGLFYYDDKSIDRFLSADEETTVTSLRHEIESLKTQLPKPYPFLHTIRDVAEPLDLKLNVRGDPYNLGAAVPRRFLPVLCVSDPQPFRLGSGRLELAEAIASPDNALTARVIVNRVWEQHFGTGLVRTPSNFGKAGDRPSHPELLDYLAVALTEHHWSLKWLHREIMLSATYGLATHPPPGSQERDPENRLLSHANRRRLDIETIRDSLLAAAGKLDLTMGGPPVPWGPDNVRRTIYGPVSRFRLERMLSLFDFPDPTITCEHRVTTNVPLQRLFFLNSELIASAAGGFARRVEREAGYEQPDRIAAAYRLLFARRPAAAEMDAGIRFLAAESDPDTAWVEYAQVLLASNEFSFVD